MGTRLPCPGIARTDWAGESGAEVGAQFFEQLGEVVAGLAEVATEGTHGVEVADGGTAEAKIDAAGVEGLEGTELLSDHKGCMIGQHDAAAPDVDGFGCGGYVADQQGCC